MAGVGISVRHRGEGSGAVAQLHATLKARSPGHLQEARIMDASPGEHYPRYLRHNISSLRRFSQVPRCRQAQVEAKAAEEGGAGASGRATPFPPAGGWASGRTLAIEHELPKASLLMSLPIPTRDFECYFSHTKEQQECCLSL